jgi:HPt (histidine-containing phosphotransfer) domain-containing protein
MAGKTVAAAVPPGVLVRLRETFGEELALRLPHLEELTDLETVRRDVHTIASGAWVVGEPEIAGLARRVETELPAGPVAELVALLRAWRP